MNAALLATKLRIPPQRRHTVRRTRLVDAIERDIRSYKLVLISAPAGYGKTTLLSQWAQTSPIRVAWLSAGEEDTDPDRFFRSLVTAWEIVHPGIIDSPLGLLLGAIDPDRDAVLAAFINVASHSPGHTVFVLDDAHLIEGSAVHEALAFLLEHLPPTIHFVLAGRAEPPLPLARYRAHHQLLEFRGEDLQFHMTETAEFLNELLRLDLTDERIASLHAQLEGWIAGLQLVSLTLGRHRGADSLVVSGRHRFIADYLSDDVLAGLPEAVRRFLVQTSILDGLCGSLCDAVTGGNDGQDMLCLLERENLFLVPLDENREWFRFHQLFAGFLREELHRHQPDEVAGLHGKAAQWHLDHNLPDQAFDHAVAGGDAEQVIQILERYESAKLHGGEIRILQGWLDAIPAAWYAAYPMLGLVRAGVLAFTGELDACVRCVDDVERRIAPAASDESRWQRARVTAFRCFVACFENDLQRAEMHAAQALQDLRDEDFSVRADIYHALGDTYRGHGRWDSAREHYLKVLDISQGPVDGVRSAHVFGALADLDLKQGRLRDADVHWRKALEQVREPAHWGRLPLPVIGWVYLRLGEICYERNELVLAWDHLTRGLEHAELGGDVRAMIAGYLLAVRVKLTEPDIETAVEFLERARPLVEQASFPEWSSRFERLQVEVWLAQHRLRAAVHWADAVQLDDVLQERSDSETGQLALARVLIVIGNRASCERAQALLGHLLEGAEAEGRAGVQIEALALRALAERQGGDRAGALLSLEHALRLAEPEGYVRLFADLGHPMARLLQEARDRKLMPDYVATLLAARGADMTSIVSGERVLTEPLSPREKEVLTLIAAGLTNREIAAHLFISPETVKKHSSSVYAKLKAGHRTEAVVRARELGILNGIR